MTQMRMVIVYKIQYVLMSRGFPEEIRSFVLMELGLVQPGITRLPMVRHDPLSSRIFRREVVAMSLEPW